jgi:tetratricopeptide (TPR) repeat protein/MFS family permease
MARSSWRIVIPGATAFLASGCFVILAMLVFRMAAAELGATLYTSTTVFVIALMSMALGGLVGSRIADRFPPRQILSVLFALSSAACVLVVVFNNALKDWTGLWRVYWPLHVSLHVGLLLLLPSTLLAATGPVAGRMVSGDGVTAGRALGTVLTWGTCGAIVGVVLAQFFLIPAYGSTTIVWSLSIVMLAVAFLYWISCWVLYVWGMVFGVLFLLATSAAPWATQGGATSYLRGTLDRSVSYESPTPYGRVVEQQISQRPDTRVLWLDGSKQATILPGDVTYVRDFSATVGAAVIDGLCPSGSVPSMLFLGSGGYVLPQYARAVWSQSHIRVAEPNPGLITAATRLTKPDSAAIETIRLDAASCVNALRTRRQQGTLLKRCDLICHQPVDPLGVSFYLVTKEFNDKLSSLLAEDGVYVLSIVDVAEDGPFLGAVVNTLEQTFPHVQVVARATSHPAAVEDYVVLAGKRALPLTERLISNPAGPAARVLDAAGIDRLKRRGAGIVLTEDRAPVETLLAPAVRANASLQLARRWFRQAAALEGQGQEEQCDTLYQRAASSDTPVRRDAYVAIGRRYLSKGDMSKAAAAFDAALTYAIEEGAPAAATAEIHAELAGAWKQMGQPSQARQHMTAAIKGFQAEVRQHPKAVVAWERLGDAFAFLEDWRHASDAFLHCVELEPDYLTHYDKLAKTLEAQQRYDEAIEVVRAQIALLAKTGRKEAAAQQTQYVEVLQYNRAKQGR